MFAVRVDGTAYVARSKTWRDSLRGATMAALTTAATYLAGLAQAGSPVKTGRLKREIRAGAVRGSSVSVQAGAPYSGFVENGTKAHDIKPKNGRFLKFKVSGSTVFARKVRHPGTRSNPFMGRARDAISQRLPAILAREVRAVIR